MKREREESAGVVEKKGKRSTVRRTTSRFVLLADSLGTVVDICKFWSATINKRIKGRSAGFWKVIQRTKVFAFVRR